METITVEVPDWIVGDGEFGPTAVGDIVLVGLALVEPTRRPAAHEAYVVSFDDGRCEISGELVTARTRTGRRLPPVVRADGLLAVLLGPLDGVVDGPVQLSGNLAVEPFHWSVTGELWAQFPEAVRAWRLSRIRTGDGRALRRIPAVEEGGGQQSYLIDLEPTTAVGSDSS